MEENGRLQSLLSSTTTSFGKIRGFTVDLLFVLKNHGLRTSEAAELTEKSTAYVSRYLKNMRKYGLTEKQGFLWFLTPLGGEFLEYFERVDRSRNSTYSIIHTSRKKKRKKEERNQKETRKPSPKEAHTTRH